MWPPADQPGAPVSPGRPAKNIHLDGGAGARRSEAQGEAARQDTGADWPLAASRGGELRKDLQWRYSRCIAQQASTPSPDPIIERTIAAINLRAGQVDRFLDCAEAELDWRDRLTNGAIEKDLLGVVGVGLFSWSRPDPRRPKTAFFGRWVRSRGVPNYVPLEDVVLR